MDFFVPSVRRIDETGYPMISRIGWPFCTATVPGVLRIWTIFGNPFVAILILILILILKLIFDSFLHWLFGLQEQCLCSEKDEGDGYFDDCIKGQWKDRA